MEAQTLQWESHLNAYISIKERHSQLAGVIGGGGCLFYFIFENYIIMMYSSSIMTCLVQ
jgi:hypothetical protein